MKSRWRVGFALPVALISMRFLGTARASAESDAEPAKVPPRPERWARLEIGFRTGYGVPFGKATGDAPTDLNGLIAGQVPIWVDLGALTADVEFDTPFLGDVPREFFVRSSVESGYRAASVASFPALLLLGLWRRRRPRITAKPG